MFVRVLVFCAVLLLLPSSSLANRFESIFTRENQSQLCIRNGDGRLIVSKDELANLIVDSARVPLRLLYRVNKDAKENFVNGRTLRIAVSTKDPFGVLDSKDEKQAAERLDGYRLDFGAYQPDTGKANSYIFPNVDSGDQLLASAYFQQDGKDILCVAPKGSGQQAETGAKQPQIKNPVLEKIFVRKSVDDLSNTLKKSGFATLAYEQKKAGHRVISAESVVAIELFSLAAPIPMVERITALPYVRYSASHGGKPTDTEIIQPGFLLKSFIDTPLVSFRIAASGALTVDAEHDAQKTDATLAVYPVVNLGGGNSFLGGPLPPLAGLSVTPDMLLLATQNHVDDVGSNEEYKKARNFYGLGAVPKVHVAFIADQLPPYLAFLAGLTSTIRYHIIQNSNEVKDVRYLDLQFAYALPGSDNWSVAFDIKRGDDPTTLVAQNYWRIGLGFRY